MKHFSTDLFNLFLIWKGMQSKIFVASCVHESFKHTSRDKEIGFINERLEGVILNYYMYRSMHLIYKYPGL